MQFVPRHHPIKITRLRLTNTGDRTRHLSLFSYARLVMGVLPGESDRFLVTELDADAAALVVGRGGWTWYTGSAGWMYRVALESVLGLRVVGGDTLRVKPCVPDHWREFNVQVRLQDGQTCYDVTVRNPGGLAAGIQSITIDGRAGTVEEGAACIALVKDGVVHRVEVTLGEM